MKRRVGAFEIDREIVRAPGLTLAEATDPSGLRRLVQIVPLAAVDRARADARAAFEQTVGAATAEIELEFGIEAHGAADASDGHRVLYWAMPWSGRLRPIDIPASAETQRRVAMHIARWLAERHRKGRTHPLLSTSLVWVDTDGGIEVLGVPVAVGLAWLSPLVPLPPLAPEEGWPEKATPAGDLWRMGCVLKEIGAGLGLPDDLAAIVERLTATAPAARPRSAADVVAALDGAPMPAAQLEVYTGRPKLVGLPRRRPSASVRPHSGAANTPVGRSELDPPIKSPTTDVDLQQGPKAGAASVGPAKPPTKSATTDVDPPALPEPAAAGVEGDDSDAGARSAPHRPSGGVMRLADEPADIIIAEPVEAPGAANGVFADPPNGFAGRAFEDSPALAPGLAAHDASPDIDAGGPIHDPRGGPSVVAATGSGSERASGSATDGRSGRGGGSASGASSGGVASGGMATSGVASGASSDGRPAPEALMPVGGAPVGGPSVAGGGAATGRTAASDVAPADRDGSTSGGAPAAATDAPAMASVRPFDTPKAAAVERTDDVAGTVSMRPVDDAAGITAAPAVDDAPEIVDVRPAGGSPDKAAAPAVDDAPEILGVRAGGSPDKAVAPVVDDAPEIVGVRPGGSADKAPPAVDDAPEVVGVRAGGSADKAAPAVDDAPEIVGVRPAGGSPEVAAPPAVGAPPRGAESRAVSEAAGAPSPVEGASADAVAAMIDHPPEVVAVGSLEGFSDVVAADSRDRAPAAVAAERLDSSPEVIAAAPLSEDLPEIQASEVESIEVGGPEDLAQTIDDADLLEDDEIAAALAPLAYLSTKGRTPAKREASEAASADAVGPGPGGHRTLRAQGGEAVLPVEVNPAARPPRSVQADGATEIAGSVRRPTAGERARTSIGPPATEGEAPASGRPRTPPRRSRSVETLVVRAASRLKAAAGNRKAAAGNRKAAAGNRKAAAGNRKAAAKRADSESGVVVRPVLPATTSRSAMARAIASSRWAAGLAGAAVALIVVAIFGGANAPPPAEEPSVIVRADQTIRLTSDPPGAEVIAEADGRSLGTTPLELMVPVGSRLPVLIDAQDRVPMRVVLPEHGSLRANLPKEPTEYCEVEVRTRDGAELEEHRGTQGLPGSVAVPSASIFLRRGAGREVGARLVRCREGADAGPVVVELSPALLRRVRLIAPPGVVITADGQPLGASPTELQTERAFIEVTVEDGDGGRLDRWVGLEADTEVRLPAPPPPPVARVEPTRVVAALPATGQELAGVEATSAKTEDRTAQGSARRSTRQAKRYYRRARRAMASGRPRLARKGFRRCLQFDSEFAECHRGLASAYRRLNQAEQADVHYRKYLELRPGARDAERIRRLLDESSRL